MDNIKNNILIKYVNVTECLFTKIKLISFFPSGYIITSTCTLKTLFLYFVYFFEYKLYLIISKIIILFHKFRTFK